MANLKYIGKNILNHELEVKSGNIIGDHTEVIRVTVVSDGGNKYAFEGATTPDLTIDEGKTYRFDQSDSTNDTHPFRFSVTQNGTWGGGSAYSTGVTTHGTPGVKGAYTEISVTKSTPNHLYYYCTAHSGMGNDAVLLKNDFSNLHRVSGSSSSTGSFGLVEIGGTDINPTGVSRDQVLKFNGTNFVPAAFDATFVFTIADFDMNDSGTELIGSGSWKAVGALTFTAAYNNGPPDGYNGSAEGAPQIRGYVNNSISSSYDMYPLSSSFTTGTNPMAITYPLTSGHTIKFRLYASAGSDTDNDYTDQTMTFRNQFVYGDLSTNNGFTQANIRTLAAANTVTSNDTSRTLSVSVGGSNYLCFAHRTSDTNVAQVQCGTGTNILTVAMDRTDATTITPLKETVSYLNTLGFTENFYVYASKIANVDAHSTTFNTLTSTVKKNYFIWGYDAQASSYDESFLETSGDWDSYNANSSYDDGNIINQTLSVGSFTSKYVIIAFPDRYGDNESEFVFKDNGTGLPFDVTKQSDVTITNAVGFQETYHVWRSTNALTMSNLTILIASV
jgi:hypothetical protein